MILSADFFESRPVELIEHLEGSLREPSKSVRKARVKPASAERILAPGREFLSPLSEAERAAWRRAIEGAASKDSFHPAGSGLDEADLLELSRLPATAALCAMRDEGLAQLARERLPERSTLWGAALAARAIEQARQKTPERVDQALFKWAGELAQEPESLGEDERYDMVAALEGRMRAWPRFAQSEEEMARRAEEALASASGPMGRRLLAQALVGAFCHGDMDRARGERLIERSLGLLSPDEAARALNLALEDSQDLLRQGWAAAGPASRRLTPWEIAPDGPLAFKALEPRGGFGAHETVPGFALALIECFGDPPPKACFELARRGFAKLALTGPLWWIRRAGEGSAPSEAVLEAASEALWEHAREGSGSDGAQELDEFLKGQVERVAVWLDQSKARAGEEGASPALLEALSSLSPGLLALSEASALRAQSRSPGAKASRSMSL